MLSIKTASYVGTESYNLITNPYTETKIGKLTN